MIHTTKSIASIVCLVLVSAAPAAFAGHDSPLYGAADDYRDAVCDFERLVLREDFVERCDERLVDDLEDSTSDLRSASRDTRRPERLFEQFATTEALHFQVQQTFFESHRYPHCSRLEASWQVVSLRMSHLAAEFRNFESAIHPTSCVTPAIVSRSQTSFRPAVPNRLNGNRVELQISVPPRMPSRFDQPSNHHGTFYRSQVVTPPSHSHPSSSVNRRSHSEGFQRHDNRYRRAETNVSAGDEIRRAIVGALLQRL
ncbi:hypothetical protein [Rhodopirellula sp. MGV]|uniref:hypothetical protein n=1 Tax=Rhodopirellula sp. MGV TaxID=2023130 RepID=UPI001179E0B4|nr:hypothetical protein [Rhodopirellula sp. MGV]